MKVVFRFLKQPTGKKSPVGCSIEQQPTGVDCSFVNVVETEGFAQLNLLAHGQLIERSLQSRCGGHCECGTCRVHVVSGGVSLMREEEKALLTTLGQPIDGTIRLACQCFPAGDEVVIEVPERRFKDARYVSSRKIKTSAKKKTTE